MTMDAVVVWPNGKAYFFQGDQYTRYDIQADRADAGYPQKTADHWRGISFDRIDAAIVWPNGKAYFFRGSQYIRYDIAADRADAGYPLRIADYWNGLFASDIDAALMGNDGKAYFFKGDQYITYDVTHDKAIAGPRPWHSRWPGLTFPRLDAAINWQNGMAYFFRGPDYIRYSLSADKADPGYPRRIADHWPGLTTPGSQAPPAVTTQPPAVAPKPRLSLWQDLDPMTYPVNNRKTQVEERMGFANLATMQAIRVQACAGVRYYGSTQFASIGPAGYRTGEDIIEAIIRASRATSRKVDRIHVFGHSDGANGIYGEHHEKQLGLYRSSFRQWRDSTPDPDERRARLTDELPKHVLANNLVVVLHGCKMAAGSDSFAHELFNFLSTGSPSLVGVRVFAHRSSVASEQNHDWIEFNSLHGTGKRSQMPADIYRRFTSEENAAVNAINHKILKR